MRTSSLLYLTAAFLLNSTTLSRAANPQPTDRTSPPPLPIPPTLIPPACDTPKSYSTLKHLPQSIYVEHTATTSDGRLCCLLCHDSNLDCAAAAFDEMGDSKNCRMAINTNAYVGAKPSEMCPLGVNTVGEVGGMVEDWSEWILGPCYDLGR